MHTVFINDQPLRFIDTFNKTEIQSARDHILYSESTTSIDELIALLETKQANRDIFYLSENPDVSWKIFISHCILIEAAGGLVQRKNGDYLIIFRHGRWDLPKGKIEYDETPEQAAVREVEEECGVNQLEIVKPLLPSFHTYSLKKKRMLKKSHWFLMTTKSEADLVPQKEEGIDEARWMDEKTIRSKVIQHSYGSIDELLNKYFGWS